MVNFYLKQPDNPTTRDFNSFFYANDFDALRTRLGDLNLLTDLASSLHAANMTLLVDIPTLSANSTVEPEIDFKITKAIQFWAGLGVNGISLVGLESYGADRFVSDRVAAWATDFEKYSKQTQRILITSYLLPESIDGSDGADRSVGKTGSDSIGDFGLLEATLDLSNLTNLQVKKTGFHSVTNRGIVPTYIIYRVDTWFKKQTNGTYTIFQLNFFLVIILKLSNFVSLHKT